MGEECYDVVIVGAGPAGIFAALELSDKSGLDVLLVEKGADLGDRRCPAREGGRCVHCEPCAITSGWGGAGAFSDGKLTLSADLGGWLDEYLSRDELEQLLRDVDRVWCEHGAADKIYGADPERVQEWQTRAMREELRLLSSPIRHMGTERCFEVLGSMREALRDRVTIETKTAVSELLTEGAAVRGVNLADGRTVKASAVIVAPGREGAAWLTSEARRLGLGVVSNAVDIGVRVEVPAVYMKEITEDLYEPKLLYTAHCFEDRVRTFCVNPGGVVCTESYGDVVTVNGHSYAEPERKTPYTNFALLVSTRFTHPFNEPIVYGKSIARLANVLGKDIIVQRLGDLRAGRRSTEARLARGIVEPTLRNATPGDLSFVLPYRYLQDIQDMLEALDRLLPGVAGRDTLLYGAEVKFYSCRLELDRNLETQVSGLYAVGDGAGVTRGLMQASASGVTAARGILVNLGASKLPCGRAGSIG